MYNNYYEDYIRSVLGYPNSDEPDYFQEYNYNTFSGYNRGNVEQLEECYPEIYKIVYPMVQRSCQNIREPITKEYVNRMVDELYSNIEEIDINQSENRNEKKEYRVNKDEQKETRQFNKGLSDIIRILLLRELLGRPCPPGRPCGRPPFPPPGRPPFHRIYEY